MLPTIAIVHLLINLIHSTAMNLSTIDLFFRFAAVGQLLLLSVIFYQRNKPHHTQWLSYLPSIACISGLSYLLLTAPIEDAQWGYFRRVLLAFTEALPYLIWLIAYRIFKDQFQPFAFSQPVKIVLGSLAMLWLGFFLLTDGSGWPHDASHALGLLVLLHIVYVAITDLQDDLVDSRRKTRVVLVVLICSHMGLLEIVELINPSLKDSVWISLSHGALIFILINVLCIKLILELQATTLERNSDPTPNHQPPMDTLIPLEYREMHQHLMTFMQSQQFTQANLTIDSLSQQLQVPAHRLRQLINQQLGFKNFSTFLNQYRITEACHRLIDPKLINTPVLSIALDLGYGSIGPFNRAFKSQVGLVPTEYRTANLKN